MIYELINQFITETISGEGKWLCNKLSYENNNRRMSAGQHPW